jgi:hypothetical protein
MHTFQAELKIIDINPYVEVPERILAAVFKQAGKNKGKIPIHGAINAVPYKQTLVRFRGEWRLYVNTKMLNRSPEKIGTRLKVSIEFDPSDRTIAHHPKWQAALAEHPAAKTIFDQLRPSLQLEIVRYIANLKTEAGVDRNVVKAIDFLLGRGRFVGRDHP